MGTGQIIKEVFVKHIKEQITLLEHLEENNPKLDVKLIEIALEDLIKNEYEN